MVKPICIVESPFRARTAHEFKKHIQYRNRCIKFCIDGGFVPLASHMMYTKVLDDNIPAERDLGISLGYELYRVASMVFFFTDLGVSEGMQKAQEFNRECYKIPETWVNLNLTLH